MIGGLLWRFSMIKRYGNNVYVQSPESPEWEEEEEGLLIEVEAPATAMGCEELDKTLAELCGDMPYSAGWYFDDPAKGWLSFGEVVIGCVPDTAENREKLWAIAQKLSPVVGVKVFVSYYEYGEKGVLALAK